MERKLKWRTIWLGAIMVFAVCMLVPTLTSSEGLPVWFSRMFNRKIQLGLDLQGGLHIVYGIDLDKAVDDKASEIKRDLEAKLEDLKIKGRVTTPASPLGAVSVIVDSAADRAKIDAKFLSDYDEIVVSRDCPSDELKDRSVCVRVSSDYAERIKSSALEQAVRTVRERIDEKGISEPNVVSKGDQIIVELPGLDKDAIKRVKDLIERTAKLEFKIVDENSAYMTKLYGYVEKDPGAKAAGVTADIDIWTHDESGKRYYDYYLAAKDSTRSMTKEEAKKRGCYNKNKAEVGGMVECTLTGREVLDDYLAALAKASPEYKIDDDHMFGFELMRSEEVNKPETTWRSYYLARPVELAGSAVSAASVVWNPTTGRPEVLIEFNRWGGRRFGELTGKAVGRKMAIILDDKINSAPVIQAKIDGGRSTITMGGSDPKKVQAEAQDLVNVLRTGSLPAPLRIDSESEVGPLLGRDAIQKTKVSFMLGAGLVVLIMLYFYRFSGLISIGALLLNVLMMLAVMAGFGATLTLPGIAALVLTLGMAVDANIVIFERARDELRHGKSVRGAVDAGFQRGFAAVLDGHLTTGMAGLVLYQYGSGPIKGFAVMLIIGIATTLFTAVWCTRLFFDYYLRKNRATISI